MKVYLWFDAFLRSIQEVQMLLSAVLASLRADSDKVVCSIG